VVQSRMDDLLSAERARELFVYDAERGVVIRRSNGRVVGGRNRKGYLAVRIDRRHYYVHRLIWLLVHGRYPAEVIDHINGQTDDNRLSNLRETTNRLNVASSKLSATNTSGLKGVSWHAGAGKWRATIRCGGKQVHLGFFEDKQMAAEAYRQAAVLDRGEFARFA
jgi:hypothetical protein